MFDNVAKTWEQKGFEILVGGCIVMFLVIGVCNWATRKKGTWSTSTWLPTFSRKMPGVKPTNYTPSKTDSKGEIECRRVMRMLFNTPFNKSRPGFLQNTIVSGNNLEIDCLDKILVNKRPVWVGVEYQGQQHYKYTPYFHRTRDAFHNQKYRDDIKRRICKEQGVVLIEVPYTVKIPDIQEYLVRECRKRGIL